MLVQIIHWEPPCTVSPRHVFLAGGSLLVGRSTRCQLMIDDRSVSRQHAEIVLTKDRVTLRDLGSTNGTYVNKDRVQACELHHGMRLQFGKIAFLLTIMETRPAGWGSDQDTGEWKVEAIAQQRLRDILHLMQVQLSDAELAVLEHLAHGVSDKVIAERLNVSLHTVQTHNKSIFKKMDVHTRAQLICRLNEFRPEEGLTDEIPGGGTGTKS